MTERIFSAVTVGELFELAQKSSRFHLLDVREEDEYQDLHAPSSRSVPLSRIMENRAHEDLRMPKDEVIYLICRSGRRSLTACDLLHHQGFTKLVNVVGGMEAWVKAGLAQAKR